MLRALRHRASHLLRLNGTPHGIALGFTLGLALSLLPIPFLGMGLALLLGPVLGASPPATYLGTAVVNPVTATAFYFSELWIGAQLLGVDAPSWAEVQAFEAAQWWALLRELLPAFGLGGGLLAIAVGLTAYPTVRQLVGRYQRRTVQRNQDMTRDERDPASGS